MTHHTKVVVITTSTILAIALAAVITYEVRKLKTTGGSAALIPTKGGAINNPGNIRTEAKTYPGEIASPSAAFKSFSSMAYGYAAMMIKLLSYSRSGYTTLTDMINHWAPASDGNDPAAYINYIITHNDVYTDPNTFVPVNDQDTILAIVLNMSNFEQSAGFVDSLTGSPWIEGYNIASQLA